MNLIDRYLGRTLLHTIFIVLFGVIGVEIFISMITELGDIGRSHYSVFSAFAFVLMNLPGQLYALFPLVGLIGMLMALGMLANHSELVILQSAGMSPLQIAAAASKTIILLLIVVSFVGEAIAPKLSEYAEHYKEKHMQNMADQKSGLAYDLWARVKNHYFYIKEIDQHQRLLGVNWFSFDQNGSLIQASIAKQALYMNNHWVATDLQQTKFVVNGVDATSIPEIILPLDMSPKILLSTNQNPNSLSLGELERSLAFHANTHVVNQEAQLSFWRRLIQPFASLVMMLLAIPFVFGPLRQSSQSLRLVVGVVIGFSFYYANQFFGPISLLFHWPALLSASLPTVLFSVVGFVLLKLQKH